VPKLNEMIKAEQERREEGDEVIIKKTNDEVQKYANIFI
jgi:hypothetical protein